MGASSSISSKLYKHVDCGCIYCFDQPEIQLLWCCYDCLETLRNKTKPEQLILLQKEVKENPIEHLLNKLEWKTTHHAIQFAHENNILVEEFICNKDVLKYTF